MREETPAPPPQLPTRPATPEEESWYTWRRADEQETPKRLEEAAKFCTGLYAITYAILLGSDADALKNASENNLKLVAGLWLVSLVSARFPTQCLEWEDVAAPAFKRDQFFRCMYIGRD